MFKCFKDLQGNWKEFVTVIWNDQHPTDDVPKELVLSIQEPLIIVGGPLENYAS